MIFDRKKGYIVVKHHQTMTLQRQRTNWTRSVMMLLTVVVFAFDYYHYPAASSFSITRKRIGEERRPIVAATTQQQQQQQVSLSAFTDNDDDNISSTTQQLIATLPIPTITAAAAAIQCDFCNATFGSRNAVFRHLRSSECTAAPTAGTAFAPLHQRQTLVLFFGYLMGDNGVTPQRAGERVLEALFSEHVLGPQNCTVVSTTQASLAKSRPACLGQELDCPAAEDVLVVSFMAPSDLFTVEINTTTTNTETTTITLADLGDTLASVMQQQQQTKTEHDDATGVVALHGVRRLETAATYIHAEQSCTQHVYQCLFPVAWLPDADAVTSWYHANYHKPQGQREPVPAVLRRVKEVLRSTESRETAARQAGARFGSLAHREKRPWHNYADPLWRLSPNYDPVLRSVDRARLTDFVLHRSRSSNGDGEEEEESQLFLVCTFSGDEFLQQQVRRIVGTAVAVAHEWLPPDFIERSVCRNVLIETPLAPAGHLYRASSRFHFQEIYFQGKRMFETDSVHKTTTATNNDNPVDWIQTQLLQRMDRDASAEWLWELRNTVAPRIRDQLLLQASAAAAVSDSDPLLAFQTEEIFTTPPPSAYVRVLELLRELVATKQWPSTSVARSSVICGNLKNNNPATKGRAGSFTVVSNEMFDFSDCPLPQANSLFPELAAAVFELEQSLGVMDDAAGTADLGGILDGKCHDKSSSCRPPSSHCAINCNAQFSPHVDSGRGAGQSLSMIVGLGDYVAGELMVEGDTHDIRYRALQFDGWKLRHWTKPFAGERFSLVWFTPEGVVVRKSQATTR